jgi:hypothetical protein
MKMMMMRVKAIEMKMLVGHYSLYDDTMFTII